MNAKAEPDGTPGDTHSAVQRHTDFSRFLRAVRFRAWTLLTLRSVLLLLPIVVAGAVFLLLGPVRSAFAPTIVAIACAAGGIAAAVWLTLAGRRRLPNYLARVDDYYDAAGRLTAAAEFMDDAKERDAFKNLAIEEAADWLSEHRESGLPWTRPGRWPTLTIVLLVVLMAFGGCTKPTPETEETIERPPMDVAPPSLSRQSPPQARSDKKHSSPAPKPAAKEKHGASQRQEGGAGTSGGGQGTSGGSSSAGAGNSNRQNAGQANSRAGGSPSRSSTQQRSPKQNNRPSGHSGSGQSAGGVKSTSGKASQRSSGASSGTAGNSRKASASKSSGGRNSQVSTPHKPGTGATSSRRDKGPASGGGSAGRGPKGRGPKHPDDSSVRSPAQDIPVQSRNRDKAKGGANSGKETTGIGYGTRLSEGAKRIVTSQPSMPTSHPAITLDELDLQRLDPRRRAQIKRYYENLERFSRHGPAKRRSPSSRPSSQTSQPSEIP